MKCVCGYENRHTEFDHEKMELILEPEMEPFIKIEGHLYIKETDNHWNENINPIELYICPKCKTVQAGGFF